MERILSTTVSVDGNTDLNWILTRIESPPRATIWVFGGGGNDFDSGTVTLLGSPDGGTTFMAINDQNGTAISFTADGVINFELYAGRNPIASTSQSRRRSDGTDLT